MKNFILSVFLILGSSSASCQENISIKDLFAQMPDSLFPYLSQNNRLDMIDFMESGMKSEVTNSFGEKSQMLALSEKYIKLHLSNATNVEMRLLDDSTLCLVKTLGDPPIESTAEIYDSKWNLIQSVDIDDKSITSLLLAEPDSIGEDEADLLKSIMSQADDIMVLASVSPGDNTLTLEPSLPLLTIPEKKLFARCKKLISLKWDGVCYKKD